MSPTRRVLIAGRSMERTLYVGEWVHMRPQQRYRPGEVVVFRGPRAPEGMCHRLVLAVRVPGRWLYVHRGDAPGAGFGIVDEADIVGRAVEVERRGRREPIRTVRPDRRTRLHALGALARRAARGAWRRGRALVRS